MTTVRACRMMQGMTSADTNTAHLYPEFRTKYVAAIALANAWCAKNRKGYSFRMTEGYRTASYQHSLYEQGRDPHDPGPIVTQRDGYNRESNHQSSCAGDATLFDPHGQPVWEDTQAYAYLGHCYRANGLDWGGDWQSIRDFPHGEWPEHDIATYKLARVWQSANGLR